MKRAFAHIGFSFAVTLLVANLLSVNILIPITIGLAVLFAASLAIKRYRQACSVPLCLGSAFFACLLLLFVTSAVLLPQLNLDGKNADVTLYLTDRGQYGDDGAYRYSAVAEQTVIDGAAQKVNVRLKSNAKLNVHGYRIIHANVDFYSIGDNAVDSHGYWGKNVFLTAKLNSYYVTDKYHSSPMSMIFKIRQDIADRIMLMLPGDEGALAVAMLTGDRSRLSLTLLNRFKLAGATHIMAVSGLHLTALTGLALLIMRMMRLSERTQSVLTIALILFYVSLAGFSKSVVRAGIMMAVLCFGDLIGRRADSLNSLGLAVLIMCLNPYAVYDIGAMLSVLSVLSLIVLYPLFGKHLPVKSTMDSDRFSLVSRFKNTAYGALSALFVSLSIFLFTAPVMCAFFGYFNVSGIASNILIVPLASLAMPLAMVTYIVSLFRVNILTAILARVLELLTGLIVKAVNFFSSFSGTTTRADNLTGVTIAAVLVLLAFCFMINPKVLVRPTAVICTVLTLVISIASAFWSSNSGNIFISPSGAVVVDDGYSVIVSGVSDRSSYYDAYDYLRAGKMNIDFLIIYGDSYYSVQLSQQITTNTVLMSEFEDAVLTSDSHADIQVTDEYNVRLGADMMLRYTRDGYVADVNGFTVGTLTGAEVYIGEKMIRDSAGTIMMDNGGGVIYDIDDDKTYGVRRLREWQV